MNAAQWAAFIWHKYTAKWGVQMPGMNFQTRSREDYNEFFEKSKYLYAKILTLFCECPLIFMGYSVSDRNIRDVLTTIVNALPPSEEEKFREHVWILGWSGEAGRSASAKRRSNC